MGVMLDAPWNGTEFAPATALDIGSIEAAIVTQLQSQISSVEVAHYPDRPETYRLTHRIGAALVRYAGASYGALRDTAAIVQDRTLKFEIAVMTRDLGWSYGSDPDGTSPGAYSILEAIRAALTGFRVAGCRKMYPISEEFGGRDRQGGVWNYAITFALSTVAIEAEPALNFPLFINGVAMEEGGQTTITIGAAPYTFGSSGIIQLPHGNVSVVTVTTSGGQPCVIGTDYSLDTVNGIITALAGGALAAGAAVEVAYCYSEIVTASTGQSSPIN